MNVDPARRLYLTSGGGDSDIGGCHTWQSDLHRMSSPWRARTRSQSGSGTC